MLKVSFHTRCCLPVQRSRTVCLSRSLSLNLLCPTQSLQSLADLRSTPHFPFSGEVDLAVGAAVESMGPEVVLGAVPLDITGVE